MKQYVIEYSGRCHSAGIALIDADTEKEAYEKFNKKYKSAIENNQLFWDRLYEITETIK